MDNSFAKDLQESNKLQHKLQQSTGLVFGLSDGRSSTYRPTDTRFDWEAEEPMDVDDDYPARNQSMYRDVFEATRRDYNDTSSVSEDKTWAFATQVSDLATMMKRMSISDSSDQTNTAISKNTEEPGDDVSRWTLGESQWADNVSPEVEVSTFSGTLSVSSSVTHPVEEFNEFPCLTKLANEPTNVINRTEMDFGFSSERYSMQVKDENASSTKVGLPPPIRSCISDEGNMKIGDHSPHKAASTSNKTAAYRRRQKHPAKKRISLPGRWYLNSPCKPLTLCLHEGECLHSRHMKEVAELLKKQFSRPIGVVLNGGSGMQQGEVKFFRVSREGFGHWVCLWLSRVECPLWIFDSCSNKGEEWNNYIQAAVEQFFGDAFSTKLMSSPQQDGDTHCGLYTIANGLCICNNQVPPSGYNQQQMLPHLQRCMINNWLQPFPGN